MKRNVKATEREARQEDEFSEAEERVRRYLQRQNRGVPAASGEQRTRQREGRSNADGYEPGLLLEGLVAADVSSSTHRGALPAHHQTAQVHRVEGHRRPNGRVYTSCWQPTCGESTTTAPILEFSADGSVPPAPFRTVHFPKDYDVPRPCSPPVPRPNAVQMDFWIRDPEPAIIEEVFEEEPPASEPSSTQSDVLDLFTSQNDEMIGSPPENLIDLDGVPLTPPAIDEPGTPEDATPSRPAPKYSEDVMAFRQLALASMAGTSTQYLPDKLQPRPPYQLTHCSTQRAAA